MTRGKIIFIDKDNVGYCSCEFNGDMHPEHKGDQIIEIFHTGYFKNFDDYEEYVERFNSRNFGYEENLISSYTLSANEWRIDDNWTDYLYIINGSGKDFYILKKDEKHVVPVNGMAIVNYKDIENIIALDLEKQNSMESSNQDAVDSFIKSVSARTSMRDVNRIEPMLAELKKVWEKHPDLRLGQLICNIVPEDKLYYVEDDIMQEKIIYWDNK